MNNSTVQRPTMMLTGQTYALELCGNLIDRIGFNNIPYLDVVEIFDADSTFVALLHFTDILLEAAQRPELPLVDHHVIADHSDSDSRAGDRAVHHIGSRNNASFRHREYLSHLSSSQRPLLERRLKQPFHRGFDLGQRVVNNGVETDIDTLLFGQRGSLRLRPDIEPDDDGVRCSCKQHI